MKTQIHPKFDSKPGVDRADAILRSCVHCGFCTSGCPTYQLLGDENDSPRGRIYLINDLLETGEIKSAHITHLDRCLTCRNCETNCPSGVAYTDLLDIAKGLIETESARPVWARIGRQMLQRTLKWRVVMTAGFALLKVVPLRLVHRLALPRIVKSFRPIKEKKAQGSAQVILLGGCVQKAATPQVNRAAEALLAAAGIKVTHIKREACCGALSYHLGQHSSGRSDMRKLMTQIEQSAPHDTPIVSTASGCGVTLKSLAKHFAENDPDRKRALCLAERVVDISEVLTTTTLKVAPLRIALHRPCTLSHGQGLGEDLAQWLQAIGLTIVDLGIHPACCGSAGTYSVLQPEMANQLKSVMLSALTAGNPAVIVTANIGCQLHLSSGSDVPVRHWLEVVWQQVSAARAGVSTDANLNL